VRDVETVAAERADGPVLARDMAAPLPLPPFHQFRGRRLRGGEPRPAAQGRTAFPVSGRVQAGGAAAAPVEPGQAMPFSTGRRCPMAPDTVFMQEDVASKTAIVVLPAGLKPGANVGGPRARTFPPVTPR